MKSILKKFKKQLSVSALAIFVGVASFSFVDNYFEVSKNLEIFTAAYREVDRSYVDPIEPGKMIRTAIEAMFKSLDPYTNFYSESEIEDFRFMTTGKYGGIGAVIGNIDGTTCNCKGNRKVYCICSVSYNNFTSSTQGPCSIQGW